MCVTIDLSHAIIVCIGHDQTAVGINSDATGIVELRLVARAVLEAFDTSASYGDHIAIYDYEESKKKGKDLI